MSHQGTVIRVKRKRTDEPLQALLVAAELRAPKTRPSMKSLNLGSNESDEIGESSEQKLTEEHAPGAAAAEASNEPDTAETVLQEDAIKVQAPLALVFRLVETFGVAEMGANPDRLLRRGLRKAHHSRIAHKKIGISAPEPSINGSNAHERRRLDEKARRADAKLKARAEARGSEQQARGGEEGEGIKAVQKNEQESNKNEASEVVTDAGNGNFTEQGQKASIRSPTLLRSSENSDIASTAVSGADSVRRVSLPKKPSSYRPRFGPRKQLGSGGHSGGGSDVSGGGGGGEGGEGGVGGGSGSSGSGSDGDVGGKGETVFGGGSAHASGRGRGAGAGFGLSAGPAAARRAAGGAKAFAVIDVQLAAPAARPPRPHTPAPFQPGTAQLAVNGTALSPARPTAGGAHAGAMGAFGGLGGLGSARSLGSQGSRSPAMRVLNPLERAMDKAIFEAFQTGDARGVWIALDNRGDPSFKRPVEGATPLMAAAWCGDEALCARVLRLGCSALATDAFGATAADLAARRGHRGAEAACLQAAAEQAAKAEDAEYVYDVYCLDLASTAGERERGAKGAAAALDSLAEEPEAGRGASGRSGASVSAAASEASSGVGRASAAMSDDREEGPPGRGAVTLAAPVQLSSREWAVLRGGEGDSYDFESDDGLTFGDLSAASEEDLGEDDEDSNDEGFAGNDYPEDEEDAEEEEGDEGEEHDGVGGGGDADYDEDGEEASMGGGDEPGVGSEGDEESGAPLGLVPHDMVDHHFGFGGGASRRGFGGRKGGGSSAGGGNGGNGGGAMGDSEDEGSSGGGSDSDGSDSDDDTPQRMAAPKPWPKPGGRHLGPSLLDDDGGGGGDDGDDDEDEDDDGSGFGGGSSDIWTPAPKPKFFLSRSGRGAAGY